MITLESKVASAPTDSALVAASLAHDREAFGTIVARYQSLICALAYSSTGSLSRSEDLAQETFVAAWRQLPSLREPVRLRAWLCGIARHLISNAQRRAGREPAHVGEPLEAAPELAADEPSPSARAIGREEEAILWRSLAKLPEGYREPLVLFYREHQSVAAVAAALGLSEDAVKQRLSRGRVLLQEQVRAFVEGTLERSNPGTAFTAGVLAALPALGAAAATTAAGVAAGKGSTGAQAAVAAGGALSAFGVVLGLLGLIGGWLGLQMGDTRRQSTAERAWAGRFWRWIVIGFAAFVVPSFAAAMFLGRKHPALLTAAVPWLGLFFVVVAVPLCAWGWWNGRRVRHGSGPGAAGAGPGRAMLVWAALGTAGMAALVAFYIWDMNWSVRRLTAEQVRAYIPAHPESSYSVSEYQDGTRILGIRVPAERRGLKYVAPADATTLALLRQMDVPCPTYVQGRDFERLGWPGRYLFLVAVLGLAAGIATLVRLGLARRRGAGAAGP